MNCVIWSVFKKKTQSLFVLKDWVLYTQDYCNAKYTPSLFQSYFMMRTLIFLLCSTWVYLHAFIVTMRPNYVWIKMSTVTWNTPACKNMLSSSSNLVFYAHLTSMVISGETCWESTDLCLIFQCSLTSVNTLFDVITVSCVLTRMANILCNEG